MSDHPVVAGPSNDEILACAREAKTLLREMAECQGRYRSARKRWKGQGVRLKSLDVLVASSRQDSTEVVAETRDTVRYLAIGRIDLTPATLFGDWQPVVTEKSRMLDDIWTAEDAGYKAGRHGVDIAECPYNPGSELQAAWLTWHQKGQAAIAREMGPEGATASVSRARPRRASEEQTQLPGTEHEQLPGEPDPVRANGHANGKPKKAAAKGGKGKGKGAPRKRRAPGAGSRQANLEREDRASIN